MEDKKKEEQRLNVSEEKIDQAVEEAIKNNDEAGVQDADTVNVYKCQSSG